MTGEVLVVDRAALFGGSWPQGFVPIAPADAATMVARLEGLARFEPRELAERTPAWKQLIPYCAVRRGASVFCVERLPSQGEARLHGRLSIGIGGHVEPVDGPIPGILARAARRELHEELAMPPVAAPTLIGLLNDDSDAVGSVHVGLVLVVELPEAVDEDAVKVRETLKMRGGFRGLVGPQPLWHDSARLESWSALLLDVFLLAMGTFPGGTGGAGSNTQALSHPSTAPENGHHG